MQPLRFNPLSWLGFMILLVASGSVSAQDPQKPVVTTSIRPLALLVAEVAGEQVELHSLIDAGQSPHTFQMRPSDRQRLADSELIFWVGPALELFLQDLMTQQDLQKKSIALAPLVLPTEFSNSPEHGDAHNEHSQHGNDDNSEDRHQDGAHDHAGSDPHIWLEPGLGAEMAQAIAASLKEIDGVDAAAIERNLADFLARLAQTDKTIQERLRQDSSTTLFTYHNAFETFADHYGLAIAGSLTFSPEVQPGARHLAEVRDRLQAAENPCILTEPQFSRQWWRSITNGIDLTISQWDPLAADIEPQPGGYIRFLDSLAQAVLDCRAP